MADRLIQELKRIDNFSDEEIDILQGSLASKFIPKGDHFLHLGQVSLYVAVSLRSRCPHRPQRSVVI